MGLVLELPGGITSVSNSETRAGLLPQPWQCLKVKVNILQLVVLGPRSNHLGKGCWSLTPSLLTPIMEGNTFQKTSPETVPGFV